MSVEYDEIDELLIGVFGLDEKDTPGTRTALNTLKRDLHDRLGLRIVEILSVEELEKFNELAEKDEQASLDYLETVIKNMPEIVKQECIEMKKAVEKTISEVK